jgi:integration host factor subunit beta
VTKSQLTDQIAAAAPHVPHREVEKMVSAMFDLMVDALKRDERIEIRGFGSFAVKTRDAREGRNPKTGQKVSVPKRRTCHFTVGKELRERLGAQTPTQASSYAGGGSSTESAPMPMAASPHRD